MAKGDLFDDQFNEGLERRADSLGGFDDDDLELEAELESSGGKAFLPDASRIAADHPLLSRISQPSSYTTDNFWGGAYSRKSYKYDYNNSYKFTPVKSTSEYLRSNSYWSTSYYDSYSTSSKVLAHEQLHEVLKELNKTINLTSNSRDGQETTLTVKFSNGLQVNDFESNTLFVNPNVMMDGADAKTGDGYYTALDAMNGQAMLCSFMKKEIHTTANAQYKECQEWSPRNIFATDIQQSASKELAYKWPGFASYISSQMDTFGVSKKVIHDNLDKKEVKLDDIVECLCYNRLSGDRVNYDLLPINFQLKMQQAEQIFNNMMDATVPNENRFQKSLDIWKAIQDLFKDDCPANGQSQNESDDEADGGDNQSSINIMPPDDGDEQGSPQEGSGGQQGDEDPNNQKSNSSQNESPKQNKAPADIKIDKNPSERNRRFTGDNSYNSEASVEGDIVYGQLDHDKKLRDRTKVIEDAFKTDLKDDADLAHAAYKLVIPAVNVEEINAYDTFVKQNRRNIDAIKNALMFHNNTATIPNYALTDGDLDEHALYKMHFGEYERLFERKETLSEKGYHVTLVIDQSGSMSGNQIVEARELTILFSEALKYLRATEYSIYGFETREINTHVYKDKFYDKHQALITATTGGGTAMGHHLAAIGDKVTHQYPDFTNKFMFILCDGNPTHSALGMNSMDYTAHIIQKLRNKGIKVYGIGICNGLRDEDGNKLFGEGNFTSIDNVKDSLAILVNRLRKFLQKASKV